MYMEHTGQQYMLLNYTDSETWIINAGSMLLYCIVDWVFIVFF